MIALGFRVKSGRAVGVAVSGSIASPEAVARVLVELSDPAVPETRQPFHDGFGMAQADERVIARLAAIVERCAEHSIGALLDDARLRGCRRAGIVVGSVIDPNQVGKAHVRAHAMEGRLFRTALESALRARGVDCRVLVEKKLPDEASARLSRADAVIRQTVAGFGRSLGSPWRTDEKAAATAAWMALA
jgi:hypothetical protein